MGRGRKGKGPPTVSCFGEEIMSAQEVVGFWVVGFGVGIVFIRVVVLWCR
jgi:hypothetical protein